MAEALIIVDVQHDFAAPTGALAVPDAEAVVDPINTLAADPRFRVVIATRDWHPPNHSSFVDHGGPWPVHCVADTPGAQLHPGLNRERIDAVIDKGQNVEDDGYSAFENPELGQLLRDEAVTSVTVVGLAIDYCVLNTARDGLKEGFLVTVDPAAVRAVGRHPGDGQRALDELAGLGAVIASPATPHPGAEPPTF